MTSMVHVLLLIFNNYGSKEHRDKLTFVQTGFYTEFEKKCIADHRPIKLNDKDCKLYKKCHYDLDNKKVILKILGCEK